MQFSFRSVSFSKDCLEAVFDFIYNRRVAWFTDSDSYFSVATQLPGNHTFPYFWSKYENSSTPWVFSFKFVTGADEVNTLRKIYIFALKN